MGCLLVVVTVRGATISWDGGGGDAQWRTPSNWSGDRLPGTDDDVVIGPSGALTVEHTGGDTRIRSLICAPGFRLSGGSLAVTTGESRIDGALDLVNGELEAMGVGTVFRSTGPVTHAGTDLIVRDGARLSLPTLSRLQKADSGDLRLSSLDPGSVLELPAVVSGSVPEFYDLQLTAADGGELRLTALRSLDGSLSVYAADEASVVDLSGWGETLANTTRGNGTLEVRDGATLRMPALRHLWGMSLTQRGSATFPLQQLHSLQSGLLRLDQYSVTLSGLTNLSGTELHVLNGSQLVLPGVNALVRTNTSDLRITAADPDSLVDIPNATTSRVEDYYHLQLLAYDGARIRLPRLASFVGGVDVYVDGPEARVELPALAGLVRHTGPGRSRLEARDGGRIDLPSVNGLEGIDATVRQGGTMPLDQLRSFTEAQLHLDASQRELPALTNLTGANLTLDNGAQLVLPNVIRLVRTNTSSLTFRVNGAGSLLRLPSVTTSSVRDYYQLELFADAGGRIELPRLASFTGSIDVYADEADSVVDLSGWVGEIADTSPGRSSLEARDGARVLIPNVTQLQRVDVAQRGTGQVSLQQVIALRDGGLSVRGAMLSLPGLTDMQGSGLRLAEGAQLTLDGVTTLAQTQPRSLTLQVEDAGTILRLPQVRSASMPPPYQLELIAYSGGRIELHQLTSLSGALDAYAEGDGSVIDLAGWTGPLAAPAGSIMGLEARDGGAIAIPGLTGLDRTSLILRRGGLITTAQLVSITRSSVLVDAANAVFGALSDTTGTTFQYLNGGTASFPTPADLQVSEIRAPDTVVAPQAVDIVWQITNRGTPVENGRWSDAVYLSSDAAPGNDQPLGTFVSQGSLPAGGSLRFTNQVLIPAALSGTWRIVVEANRDRLVFEGTNTANNASIATSTTEVRAPDLLVESVTLEPNPATLGLPGTLQWTVRNAGTATASGPWLERLTLRAPAGSGLGDIPLHTETAHGPLAPGASGSRSASLRLPLPPTFPAGTHTLVAQVDVQDVIAEGRETNNLTLHAVSVLLPPLPDLRVTSVEAPSEALAANPIPIRWQATNQGPAVARAPWIERVQWLPNSGATAPRNLLLHEVTNDLPSHASAPRSRLVTLPAGTLAGSYTIQVIADADDAVYEGQEDNNATATPAPLNVPAVLDWQIPITEIAENAPQPAIPALLSRNGDPTQPLVATLSSEPSGELALPASITFPAGQSTVPVTLTVVQDGLPDSDTPTTLRATAPNYHPASTVVHVLNTDLPRLTLQPVSTQVTEGQALTVTVSRDGPDTSPLTVHVAAPGGSQLIVPEDVVIPAGQSSVGFAVVALDDSRLEPSRTARLEVSAAGTLGDAAILTITDNDLPAFTLTLADSRVPESGGVAATTATLSRGAPSPRSLVVTVESSQPGLVRVPESTTIPAGQASVSFPVEVIDNLDVEEARTAVLRASALATGSSTVVATTAPVTLTVTDDDGPALAVSAERNVLAEGVVGATFLVVSRNTTATTPLTVTLDSSLPGEVMVPSTALIPGGTNQVRVPLTTVDDNRVDGSQTVRITASAPGHIPGEVSLTVTDLPYPDLIIPSVTGPESGETEASINVAYRVQNQGLAAAGTNWVTRVFLSTDATAGEDTLLVEYSFGGTLPVGQYFAQSRQIRLPSVPGDYWLVAVTDVAGQIPEILENNNTTVSTRPIRVDAAYRAVVEAEPAAAAAGTPITLRGTALRTSTGGPAPFVLVNLHIGVRGTHRILSALTDELGRYSAVFQPLPGEAGIYEVGAAHPGASTTAAQDSFMLYGMTTDPSTALVVRERSSITGQRVLRNLGDAPLKGLQVTVVSNLPGVQVTATVPAAGTLGGLAEAPLGFAITAEDGSAGQGVVVLRVTSTEGARLDIPLPVVITPDEPLLETQPSELIAGARTTDQAMVRFDILNTGGSASEPVHVALPPELAWVRVASPNPVPSIAPGGTNSITLQLRPGAEVPLGQYDGSLLLRAGAQSVNLPFRFRVLSEARGDLRLTAVDEYTYYAEGAPKVAGAEVTILDAISEQVVTQGVTDATGELLIRQLPEGWYDVRVRADQHAPFRNTALVIAGFETNLTALLPREAVRYLWTVVPTEIEDRTRITIETVFEAFVPMPVVTIEPNVIDLADVTAEVTQIELRITNHGLVAAQNARLGFGEHPDWGFEPLIELLGDLPARSTLTVPLLIRRQGTGGTAHLQTVRLASRVGLHAGGGGCGVSGGLTFEIPCGGGSVGGGAGVAVVNAGGDCGGGGGGGFPGGSGGSSGGRSGTSGGGSGSSASIRSCDPCLLAIMNCLLEIVLPDFLDCAKDLYGCAKHGKEDASVDAAWDCTKAGLTCAEALGAELTKLNTAIDIIECIQDLAKNCGTPPAGGGGGGGDDEGGGGQRALASRSRSPSLHATLSSRVERAELTILRQRADWLAREMAPVRYLLGHDAWLGEPTPVGSQVFLSAFLARIERPTADGIRVDDTEAASLLATPVPTSVTPPVIQAFIDRWNRSVDYWTAGIFQASDLTPGQDPDFIDMEVLGTLSRNQIEADAESLAAGFRSPSDAFNRAGADILRFLGEGDSGGVCAHVRLRLDQDLIATRDAFDATLEIENALGDPLEQVSVEVLIRRRTGEGATSVFVVQGPTLTGLSAVDGTGILPGGTTGKVRWLLIPTPESALEGPVEYLVGGQLRYRQGGLNLTVPLAPATITVHPSPSLAVTYFHQRNVFADDPFTTAIEPSVPYSLAVMVQNKGRGTAHQVRIASAQPRIVENEKGLLADFKIIATEVAGQNLQPSLTVDFGAIAPGTNAIGRWLFTSSILGGFLEYSATVEHQNDLGDKRLALVEGIEIHELIHIVRAPGARDDGRPDFLANDVADLLDDPDTLHLSDGSREPVAVVLHGTFDETPGPGQLEVHLTTQAPPGWVYLRLPDPGEGRLQLVRVVRSDGVELPFGENAWTTDRTFLGNARRPLVEDTVHLFDLNSTGRYQLTYAVRATGDIEPPTSQVATLPTENTAVFAVTWDGADTPGGSGISFFDVYAAVDDQPFAIWQTETLDRSATYQGALGRTYRFYSVATDLAGNREAAPTTPDALTRVTRVNRAPTLAAITDQVVREGATLSVQPVALDPDGDRLVFSLENSATLPPGILVHPYTGLVTWVTGEGSGPASHRLTLQVLDNGAPRLGAMRSFQVAVTDENSAPILEAIGARSIREGETLTFTNRVTDPDLPAQTLTFALGAGAPAGATLDSARGVFRWTPQNSQGGATYAVEILVHDSGSPPLSARQVFHIAVDDSRADFAVALGDTHGYAGEDGSLPIQLTSGPDLSQLVVDLQLVGEHVLAPELVSVPEEVLVTAWEVLGPGRFRLQLDLAPVGLVERNRTVAHIEFGTRVAGRSGIDGFRITDLTGVRRHGELSRNALSRSGRVFVVEAEPLLDASPAPNGRLALTLFGRQGRAYQLQRSSSLGIGAAWTVDQTLQLQGRTQTLEIPRSPDGGAYYRVVEP